MGVHMPDRCVVTQVLGVAALLAMTVGGPAIGQSSPGPSGPAASMVAASSPTASVDGVTVGDGSFGACPIDLASAQAIAGRTLEASGAYDGAPVFSGETIDGVTSWICAYRVPGDPSVSQWNVHLEYAVDASAEARWQSFLGSFLNDQYTDVSARLGMPAYERVWTDDPDAAELALVMRGPTSTVFVGVAAYGTTDTLTDIRPIEDAFATALTGALGT